MQITDSQRHKKMPTQAVLVETSDLQSSTAQMIFLSTISKAALMGFRELGRRFS